MRKLIALALVALALAGGVAVISVERRPPRTPIAAPAAETSPFRGPAMRKLIALALLALALAGGVAVVSLERPTPAHADCGSPNC